MKVKVYYELLLNKEIEVDDKYLPLVEDDFNDLTDGLINDVNHQLNIINGVNSHISEIFAINEDNREAVLYENI